MMARGAKPAVGRAWKGTYNSVKAGGPGRGAS